MSLRILLISVHFLSSIFASDVLDVFHDSFGGVLLYEYSISNPNNYNSSQTPTACDCRMKCQVDPDCLVASAVDIGNSYSQCECRTSNMENVVPSALIKLQDSVTFYKRVNSYYPTDSGVFYVQQKGTASLKDAQELCLKEGGQLIILKTMQDYYALEDLAKIMNGPGAKKKVWVNMEIENSDATPVWGDGTFFNQTELDGNVVLNTLDVGSQPMQFMLEYQPGKTTALKADYPGDENRVICEHDYLNISLYS